MNGSKPQRIVTGMKTAPEPLHLGDAFPLTPALSLGRGRPHSCDGDTSIRPSFSAAAKMFPLLGESVRVRGNTDFTPLQAPTTPATVRRCESPAKPEVSCNVDEIPPHPSLPLRLLTCLRSNHLPTRECLRRIKQCAFQHCRPTKEQHAQGFIRVLHQQIQLAVVVQIDHSLDSPG